MGCSESSPPWTQPLKPQSSCSPSEEQWKVENYRWLYYMLLQWQLYLFYSPQYQKGCISSTETYITKCPVKKCKIFRFCSDSMTFTLYMLICKQASYITHTDILLTCVIYKLLDLLFKPLLIVNTDIFFMLATTTMCFPHRRLTQTNITDLTNHVLVVVNTTRGYAAAKLA